MRPTTLNLKGYDKNCLPFKMREAVNAPGVMQRHFFEENGYEYEYWYLYLPKEQIMHTNDIRCPYYHHHHLGSTCAVCGLKD